MEIFGIVVVSYGLAVYFSRDLGFQVKVKGLDVLVCMPNGDDYRDQVQTYVLAGVDNQTGRVWISILKHYEVTSLHIKFNLTAYYNGEPIEGVTATVSGVYKMIWYHTRDHVWHYHDYDVPIENMDFYGVTELDLSMMDWKYVAVDYVPPEDQNCLELTFTFDTTGVDPTLTDEILDLTITITITE